LGEKTGPLPKSGVGASSSHKTWKVHYRDHLAIHIWEDQPHRPGKFASCERGVPVSPPSESSTNQPFQSCCDFGFNGSSWEGLLVSSPVPHPTDRTQHRNRSAQVVHSVRHTRSAPASATALGCQLIELLCDPQQAAEPSAKYEAKALQSSLRNSGGVAIRPKSGI
jgi:hypothetical protein